MSEHELGPLPEAEAHCWDCGDFDFGSFYTADQMRAYALAEVRRAVEMERERCAAEVALLKRERDDYRARFEAAHMAQMNKISGGRYPDGSPAW